MPFALTSWREKFAVKYFAQILFSHAFVALSALRNCVAQCSWRPPLGPQLQMLHSNSTLLQRKLYQCALSFQEFAATFCCVFSALRLPSTHSSCFSSLSLLLSFCFRPTLCHVLAFSTLICIVFAHFVVAFVMARAVVAVASATCNVQLATLLVCLRFLPFCLLLFSTISLKRKLEKLARNICGACFLYFPLLSYSWVLFSLFLFFAWKFSNQLCHRVCNNDKNLSKRMPYAMCFIFNTTIRTI